MSSLPIPITDDQIPPTDVSKTDFRRNLLRDFGDTEANRSLADRCVFMGQVGQALRDYGDRVSMARTYGDTPKDHCGKHVRPCDRRPGLVNGCAGPRARTPVRRLVALMSSGSVPALAQ